jgi:beta-lactamase class A
MICYNFSMPRKLIYSLLGFWILSLGFSTHAATPEAHSALAQRLTRLCASYEAKVGVTFIDLRSGRELSINGDRPFLAASVAKVPVMAAAFHLADRGELDLQKKLRFREKDKLGGSGILQWMRGGTSYTRWNLARMMIVLSDNTATRLLVNDLGLPAVNAYINSSGLLQTSIVDPTMLNEPPAVSLNKTSPRDMARLLAMIGHSQGFSPQSKKEMLSFMRNQRYRWGIWRGVPPGTVVADKTGNIEGVLNDAGIVFTKQGNYILSVFTNGFKKQRDARLFINRVSQACYEEFTGQKLSLQPSVKSKRRSGRYARVSNRKLRLSRRRSPAPRHYRAVAPRLSRPGIRASKPLKGSSL